MNYRSRQQPVDVLLVEDNPGDARLVQEAFKSAAVTVTVQVVADGDVAIGHLTDALEDESTPYPDLVLLDLNLPRVDGFDVLDEIRTHADLAGLPIIVLTSSQAQEDVTKSYELAANAYLTKPTGPDAFDELVEALEEFWFESAQLPPIPA